MIKTYKNVTRQSAQNMSLVKRYKTCHLSKRTENVTHQNEQNMTLAITDKICHV